MFDIGGDAMLLFHCFDLRAKHHDPQSESDIKDEGVGLRFPCFEHCNFGIWRRSSGFGRGAESGRNVNHVGIDNKWAASFITENELFASIRNNKPNFTVTNDAKSNSETTNCNDETNNFQSENLDQLPTQ